MFQEHNQNNGGEQRSNLHNALLKSRQYSSCPTLCFNRDDDNEGCCSKKVLRCDANKNDTKYGCSIKSIKNEGKDRSSSFDSSATDTTNTTSTSLTTTDTATSITVESRSAHKNQTETTRTSRTHRSKKGRKFHRVKMTTTSSTKLRQNLIQKLGIVKNVPNASSSSPQQFTHSSDGNTHHLLTLRVGEQGKTDVSQREREYAQRSLLRNVAPYQEDIKIHCKHSGSGRNVNQNKNDVYDKTQELLSWSSKVLSGVLRTFNGRHDDDNGTGSSSDDRIFENNVNKSASSSLPDHAQSPSLSTKSTPPKTKPKLTFNHQITIVPIPSRNEYSYRIRDKLWSSPNELNANAHRNILEFTSEGWDWNQCVESEQMRRCTVTGELIHPVHYQF